MEKKLIYALILSIINFSMEVTAGILSSSLALLSDAVHIFTDISAISISLLAIKIGRKPSDQMRNFGYRRFEILAAATNSLLLFFSAFFILYHAYYRLIELPKVHYTEMLIVAIIGLILNILATFILASGKKDSLNIKAAYNDSLADLISSVGVIIAALIIRYTGLNIVDPIIAIIIGFWLLPRCYRLLSESIHVLLEGAPKEVNIVSLTKELKNIPSVLELHHLKVWSITTGVNNLTAHLVTDNTQDQEVIKQALKIANQHKIIDSTFQIESNSLKCKL